MIALVANPAAASGKVGRRWDASLTAIKRVHGDVTVFRTERHGEARELAAQAVRAGAHTVLSLGGDGTHSQVVAGLMDTTPEPGALAFGPLPAGTGSDFCRNYACEGTLEATLQHHLTGCSPLDVCSLTYTESGAPKHTTFLNIASAGIGGLIDAYVARAPRWLGGRLAYFGASLLATARYKTAMVEVIVDGESKGEHPTHAVCMCNGRWFGGGMHIAPNARIDDGQLEVVLLPPLSVVGGLRLAPAVYSGQVLQAPNVRHWPARHVKLIPVTEDKAYMDVDGESLGVAPCEALIKPNALTLLGTVHG